MSWLNFGGGPKMPKRGTILNNFAFEKVDKNPQKKQGYRFRQPNLKNVACSCLRGKILEIFGLKLFFFPQ